MIKEKKVTQSHCLESTLTGNAMEDRLSGVMQKDWIRKCLEKSKAWNDN